MTMMRTTGGINFASRRAFWLGVLACTAGVVLHLPMYWSARHMGFRMAGMRPDAAMLTGMALIIAGLAATVYGLVPRAARAPDPRQDLPRVRALDDTPLSARHLILAAIMAVAVTIDVMKPTALAFVAPGVGAEYGLKSALNPHGGLPVSLLPLAGISGTVIGSLTWGWLGDRIGRRASILLAAVLFTTTAICGAMPAFSWNLVMCFLMGLAAGGLLPITFTLLAETIPARHRGWLIVLVGGDIAGAYIITSWLAGWLVPHYSWRILWLIGLPTGLLLILLNRWIPESPRFLISTGRWAEAKVIMQAYGAEIISQDEREPAPDGPAHGRYLQFFRPPFLTLSVAICVLGLAVGMVTYGFQLWIPTNLQKLGFTEVTSANVLRDAAILGLPLNFAAAWLYGFWSSKKTIILLGVATIAALLALAAADRGVVGHTFLLDALLAVPIWSVSSMAALVAAYASEIYPTRIRSRGTGLAAGASKAGGVIIITLVVAAIAVPSLAVTAVLGAVPMLVAVLLIAGIGVETRDRRLEDITPRQAVAAMPAK
jgi:putative MFS transporter